MIEAFIGVAGSLIGVIVGAGIVWLKDWCSLKQSREKNARYLAIRIVCVLDQYADRCVEVTYDAGLFYDKSIPEEHLRSWIPLPPPPSYPTDVDWTSINQNLMYRAFSLPNQAEAVKRLIDFRFLEIDDSPDIEEVLAVFEERQFRYADLGLLACKIAENLRKPYNIPRIIIDGCCPERILQAKIDEIRKIRPDLEDMFLPDFQVGEEENI